jgi:hypothetical protein
MERDYQDYLVFTAQPLQSVVLDGDNGDRASEGNELAVDGGVAQLLCLGTLQLDQDAAAVLRERRANLDQEFVPCPGLGRPSIWVYDTLLQNRTVIHDDLGISGAAVLI